MEITREIHSEYQGVGKWWGSCREGGDPTPVKWSLSPEEKSGDWIIRLWNENNQPVIKHIFSEVPTFNSCGWVLIDKVADLRVGKDSITFHQNSETHPTAQLTITYTN